MLKNNFTKKEMLKEREQHLGVLLNVANLYKKASTDEEKKFYMDYIMWLGKITKQIKDDLDNEDYKKYKTEVKPFVLTE